MARGSVREHMVAIRRRYKRARAPERRSLCAARDRREAAIPREPDDLGKGPLALS